MKPRDTRTIFVDVDGTLLFWPGKNPGGPPRNGEEGYGKEPEVNVGLVEHIREKIKEGVTVVVWITGGPEHAKMAVRLCGLINERVNGKILCCGKPGTCFDDGDPFRRAEVVKVDPADVLSGSNEPLGT